MSDLPTFRKPVRLVAQMHVYYDDESSGTFSTPMLESQCLHPTVIQQFIVDYCSWLQAVCGRGFPCPYDHKTVAKQVFESNDDTQATQQLTVMPVQIAVTPSFVDNPNDSVLEAIRYPGCELKYQMPVLVGAKLGPLPNWKNLDDGVKPDTEPPSF